MTSPAVTRYTRVTLTGTRRRVDVVVPCDEPVGRLLPEAIRLLAEPPTDPPSMRHLAGVDGTLLDDDATLAELEVQDGALLRLVGLADAPPPPVVHDIVEETVDDHDRRAWRWGPASRHGLAVAVLAGGAVLALLLVGRALDGGSRTTALVAAPVALTLLGATLGRLLPEPLGMAMLVAGACLGGYAVLELADGAGRVAGGVAAVAAVTATGLGLGTRLGRGVLLGGLVGTGLAAGWVVVLLSGVDPHLVAAGAAVLAVALLGLLPRIALTGSGLTALDDRRSRDVAVGRVDVTTALTAAHRGLAVAAVAVAASAGVAGWLLGRDPTGWTVALAGLLVGVLTLRARAFPLALPVVALAASAAATAASLVVSWMPARAEQTWPLVAAVLIGAVAVFGALVVDPPEHVRARVRRVADRLEMIAVVLSVPVALGVSGIYGHLLEVF